MKKGGNVVAVLMEAKLTSHSKSQHALGQVRRNSVGWIGEGPVLGYYIKFGTAGLKPPLCAVVSERHVQFVCFPYKLDTVSEQRIAVVDCLVLPEIPLFFNTNINNITSPSVNHYMLGLMLLLSNSDDNGLYNSQKPLVALENATKKSSVRDHIQSVTEQILEQLNKKDKELEKIRSEKEEIKDEMERKMEKNEREMEKKEREMEKIRSEKEEMKNELEREMEKKEREMEKMRLELENCKKRPASPSPDESAKV